MKTEVLVIGPRMRELEDVIARGMQSFVDVGSALAEIKERRLYKERDFKSFDDYVRDHWGFKRARAYQLIEAAKTVEEVSTTVDIQPTSERQTRELARSDEPAEVWAEVVDQHEPQDITAAVIREHVEARKPETQAAEATPDDFSTVLAGVTSAVRTAVRAGATTQELYNAYQAGFR